MRLTSELDTAVIEMLRYTQQRTSSILARFQRHAAACSTDQQASTSSSPSRAYASDESAASTDAIGNEKVQKLAQEIMGLTVLESSWLSEILRKRLNIAKPAFGAMPMGMPMMAATPAGAAPAAEAAAPPVEKKEKTEFEVKLTSYTPEGKIKVIKEVRAITGLGLKEAKELVRARKEAARGAGPACMHANLSWLAAPLALPTQSHIESAYARSM